MNYYLARDGQTYGPYPEENFAGMLAGGQVLASDYVCAEGGSEWIAFEKHPAFSSVARSPVSVIPASAPAQAYDSPKAVGLRVSTTAASRPVTSTMPAEPAAPSSRSANRKGLL